MLLHVIFLQYISFASASQDLYTAFMDDLPLNDEYEVLRFPRQKDKDKGKADTKDGTTEASQFGDHETPTCDQMGKTSPHPFVVIMLLRTSGRFLGMGSIIDKKTIITAAKVVEHSMRRPSNLVILAGRLCPWWGRHSQIQHANEIYLNDLGLALVILRHELEYNKNILPINLHTLPVPIPPDFKEEFTDNWAVFGVPRSSWDIPGDTTTKTSTYIMRVETVTQKPEHADACKASYPDIEYNDTVMVCTYANGTYCWGSIGSPTVAVNKADKLLQIAVLTSATFSEVDEYHIHVKVGFFEQWIGSHSLKGFSKKQKSLEEDASNSSSSTDAPK